MYQLERTYPLPLYQGWKATMDLVLAILLLIALAPVLLVLAVLICLDSPGPALYRQQRVGMSGKAFTIYKFRTMHVGTPVLSTEEMQCLGLNSVTRVGRLLRKTSLDELPQLLNILKGEMSFIGPRPALLTQTDVNILREQTGADAVRPGITGLAQVMGRDDLDVPTKVHYDAEYCRQLSLRQDCRILLLTLAAVKSARGNK